MKNPLKLLLGLLPLLLLCPGCGTGLYVACQCDDQPEKVIQTSAWPVGNILRLDATLLRETWEGPEDRILPPWLDRSLNTLFVVIDMPISLVFDIATSPYQLWRYYHLPEPPPQNSAEFHRSICKNADPAVH